ncbi:hypothetical protein SteCoe_9830 [Stentor coeruleus]|uniref:Rab-GAP TBC domain-containing protein n=1 Tax=Stentor coeruleus TaxID=5963 RepID=A0A1R2CGW1_9CILI|nr:hypothetical protein SteCoe_9830 [Stentor coeruleus]
MGSGCCSCAKKIGSVRHKDPGNPPDIQIITPQDEEREKSRYWDSILKDFSYFNDPITHFSQQYPSKFKKLLISGPPNDLRWEVWKSTTSFSLTKLESFNINPEFLQLIEKDIDRTFPFHPFFTDHSHILSLGEVLKHFVQMNPDLGYCQGMNYLAGILLITSNGNSLETSIMMNTFIQKLNGKGLFEPGFTKVLELSQAFSKVFKEKIPSLYNHFVNIELDENLWLTKWFMTMFSYSFKYSVVVRLWDVILATNLGFMVNLALAILQSLRKIMESKDLSEMLEFFGELRNFPLDVEGIIGSCTSLNSWAGGNIESFFKDTEMDDGMADSQFRLNLDTAEGGQNSHLSVNNLAEYDGRKRSNSLIIQHSPKNN